MRRPNTTLQPPTRFLPIRPLASLRPKNSPSASCQFGSSVTGAYDESFAHWSVHHKVICFTNKAEKDRAKHGSLYDDDRWSTTTNEWIKFSKTPGRIKVGLIVANTQTRSTKHASIIVLEKLATEKKRLVFWDSNAWGKVSEYVTSFNAAQFARLTVQKRILSNMQRQLYEQHPGKTGKGLDLNEIWLSGSGNHRVDTEENDGECLEECRNFLVRMMKQMKQDNTCNPISKEEVPVQIAVQGGKPAGSRCARW